MHALLAAIEIMQLPFLTPGPLATIYVGRLIAGRGWDGLRITGEYAFSETDGSGANNEDIAVCLSPQLRSSSRALLNENSLTTLFPDDGDVGSGWIA